MPGINAMNIADIELASRNAWPALEEQNTDCGVLRYAAGVSRRANSMNPCPGYQYDAQTIISTSEAFFSQRQQPSIVRVIAPDSRLDTTTYLLDCALGAASYQCEAPTAVMVKSLAAADISAPAGAKQIRELERCRWLAHWYALKSQPTAACQVHQKMLARISDPGCFVAHFDVSGAVLATAMAVRSASALGIFGVATGAAFRRRGLAAALVRHLLAWGQEQGASYAYLQVETANVAAINLYRALGFSEYYSYWYRVKPMDTATTMKVTTEHA